MNIPCIELHNKFYYTNTLDKSLSEILSVRLRILRESLKNYNSDLHIYNDSLAQGNFL